LAKRDVVQSQNNEKTYCLCMEIMRWSILVKKTKKLLLYLCQEL